MASAAAALAATGRLRVGIGIAPAPLRNPAAAAERIRSLWDAGGGTVVLRPVGPDPLDQVRAALAALGRL